MYYIVQCKKSVLLFLIGSLLNVSNLFALDIPVNPLFMPVIFTGKVLPDGYLENIPYQYPKLSDIDSIIPDYMTLNTPLMFEKELREKGLRRKAYLYLVTTNPSIVKYTLDDFPKEQKLIEQMKVNRLSNLFEVNTSAELPLSEAPKTIVFRKYWVMSGNNLLQFSQSHVSDNWYKGGVGSLNVLSSQQVKIKYNKDKIQFNSLLEWNTSLFTNPNGNSKKPKIGTDVLRLFNDFGIRALKGWFYSTNIEIKTQLFDNYVENTNTKTSSFFSPLFVNMGIMGMRYELDKKYTNSKYKFLKISADFSPLSVKYSYVNDTQVDPARYGIPSGEHYLFVLGSTINATMQFNINRSTSIKSRFKYFTNYEKMEIESESEMNFSINRYFSTRIYLHLRYDNGEMISKDPTLGYVQMNQLLSFGFNYKW